ncbi:serine hydrolase domain-containing protein [Cohnella nanjingensis]|uniref:Serine hydrolase n=1 Tax=Cohnella nanjingensis TaxID=1387779 RepID=A0A7X0RT76_9BACL|nr:serine hydrolase domain-containing protein [Cohnella nanjingensis]MBB6673071.1 serine hydrolase [Cohnella nanjingensis]
MRKFPFPSGRTFRKLLVGGLTAALLLPTAASASEYAPPLAGPSDPQEVYPLADFVKDNIPTIIRKPGAAYRYDNCAYNLLGCVVQNVTGQPFEKVVRDRIFAPLGMKNSYFVLTPDVQRRLATPYDGDGQPLAQYATFPNDSSDGLAMSQRTVEYHLTSINQKLGVKTWIGAVARGYELGLLGTVCPGET